MSEMQYHFDPLERALYGYLRAMDDVAENTKGVFAASYWPQDVADAATRLHLVAKRHDLLAPSNESDLDFLLREVDARVRAGTYREYSVDECYVAGGWFEHGLTEEAWEIQQSTEPFRMLQHAWCDVKRVIRAEELSLKARS